MTVGTCNPAHTRYIGHWYRCRRRWCQINDPFTIGPRTGNSLTAALAYKKTVARASHILSPWWCISNRSSLVTRITFHNMLIFLPGYIDHAATHPATDHGYTPGQCIVRRRKLIRPNWRHCGGRVGASNSIQLYWIGGVITSKEGLSFYVVSHD